MPQSRLIIGLDIGGANIKAATNDGRAQSLTFPLWKSPDELPAALVRLLQPWCQADRTSDSVTTNSVIAAETTVELAVTMTGELADCFETKAEGVAAIVNAVESAARKLARVRRDGSIRSDPGLTGPPDGPRYWSTAGRFVSAAEAIATPMAVAAANWHALAAVIAQRYPRQTGLLIDIGSTTTDIIPWADGQPIARGSTDLTRLQHRELLYTGLRRTPLCAVVSHLGFRGNAVPVAAELFATTRDVYLLLGETPEAPDDCETANGRPATIAAAYDRLVRQLCADRTEISVEEATGLARQVAAAQQQQIAAAVETVAGRLPRTCDVIVVTGEGDVLADYVLARVPSGSAADRVRWRDEAGAAVTTAACAAAVATLAMTATPP